MQTALAGKDRAEINFFAAETESVAMGQDKSLVVKGVVDIRQAPIGARRRLMDLGWALLARGNSVSLVPA
jgi:hypothetical protein